MIQDPYRDTNPDLHEPTREHWADRAEARLRHYGVIAGLGVLLFVLGLVFCAGVLGAAHAFYEVCASGHPISAVVAATITTGLMVAGVRRPLVITCVSFVTYTLAAIVIVLFA